jgi:hypothetical protein
LLTSGIPAHDLQVDAAVDQGPLAFGVVANVTPWTARGEGGLELASGLRHFPSGAKVWVLPVIWVMRPRR